MKNLLAAAIFVVAGIVVTTISTSSLENQGHPDTNKCIGECYANYVAANGTIVEQERAKAAAAAAMSPAELGKTAFVSCQACHGANGEGGVGPQLSGRDSAYIIEALNTYKANGTRGAQSALMWGVASPLSETDMQNLGAYVESL
jgi:cytochrome c553